MMKFTSITALLWTLSWISVSVAEFHTVEVQPGEDVTLLCSNFSSFPSHIIWFKLDDRPNITCISSMVISGNNASFCDGFQNGKFNMMSNTTTLFLEIQQVDLSDSGLYFCGFNANGKSVIVSATYLKVQDAIDGIINLTSLILAALIIVLVIVVFGLTVTIRKLHRGHEEEQNPQHSENLDSDALNYAALNFRPKAKSSGGPPSKNQLLESNVVYATARSTKGTSGRAAQSGAAALSS